MATKLYLHDATTTLSGSLPGSSTLDASSPSVTASGASTNRAADTSIGSSQKSISTTNLANTSAQSAWHRRYLSPPLAAQTISAQTLTYSLAASENNANSNFNPTIGVYLWRPSSGTKIGVIMAVGTITATEPSTVETATSGTGTSTSQTAIDGDILVIETWRKSVAQGTSTARTSVSYYDGTTEASASNNAAFVQFANTLAFSVSATAGLASGTGVVAGAVATSSAYVAAVLDDSPQGFWVSGVTTDLGSGLVNSGASPANCAYVGSPSTGASILPADSDTCLVLNGSSQYAIVGTSGPGGVTYALGDTFSIELWFETTNLSTFQIVAGGSGYSVGSPGISFNGNTVKRASVEQIGNAYIADAAQDLVSGTVYHLVWTKGGSSSHVYLNGTDVTGSVSNLTFTNPTPGAGDWVWGVDPNESSNWFTGKIQYPALYSVALTSTQVAAHYTAGTATAGTNAAAGNAAGTGASYGASETLEPSAGNAAGTGASYAPTAMVAKSAAAGNAAGTGASYQPVTSLGAAAATGAGTGAAGGLSESLAASAGAAVGTGAAGAPAGSLGVAAGAVSGTGAAQDATVTTGSASTNAAAGNAAATGASGAPAASISVAAGLAAGTGAAYGPSASVAAKAALITATGSAFGPVASLGAMAGRGAGTGTAYVATTTLAALVAAGWASGSGMAGDAAPTVTYASQLGVATVAEAARWLAAVDEGRLVNKQITDAAVYLATVSDRSP